ncbi:T-cell immunomodulatory protein-like isoform X2 [Patiria miniata]|uniref:T-cell immunomodulatory protein TIP C2 domain-containing protein n=1 Tax=Patiria miniata TaxID=46514 RepID=A0A914AXM3_PATMI|nr:T-cell immunomodulatory protein-like isoform X2 [Patiria miniata]
MINVENDVKLKMSPFQCCVFLFFTLFSIAFSDDLFAENTADFSDTTNQVFGGVPGDGIVAAYGDFDSDKRTDVFVIRENGHVMDIYFQQMKEIVTLSKTVHSISITRNNDTITSVVPGDFDGNSQMDVLITTKPNGRVFDPLAPTSAFVYWGQNAKYKLGPVTTVTKVLKDQPLMMDYNADMVPDLFGVDMDGVRQFWTFNDTDNHDFVSIPLDGPSAPLQIPNSNAFLDLTGNYAADLFVTSLDENDITKSQFEIWQLLAGEPDAWKMQQPYSPPELQGKAVQLGQSSFADMNADGKIDHVLPVCLDSECRKSLIYMRDGASDEWILLLDMSATTKEKWGFVPPKEMSKWAYMPITARLGDTNMDSYPDILCILRSGSNETRRVVLLENKDGKSLEPVWDSKALNEIEKPILATFMDLTHTGILDILVVNQSQSDVEPQIHVIKNNFAVDAYFFKTHILSGLCFSDCDGISTKPYGVNQPGPFIHYTTTSSTGVLQHGAAPQLYQSAYFSLQLPYVVLGLGQNPNYVDYLTVSAPSPTRPREENARQHTFTSIIPNSEVIVIPFPLDTPEEWKSVLIITPGRSVLVTGGVLVGTCVFMALVVGILQLLEKREDDREKRQESHRFHFDAM